MTAELPVEPEPTTPEVVLRLAGITKAFGALTANNHIDLELRRGEVVALLGENGAGKTTLMNILFGHYVADAGSIEVFGKPLPAGSPQAAIAAGIGMVHQHFTLAENLSVLDNVLLGTQSLWRPWQSRSRGRRALIELAGRLGLEVNHDALVGGLSVGERQRVEILKALFRDARILILDEPTAVLTPQESERLFGTIRRLVNEGLSVVFISHKLNEVMAISDRVVVLSAGEVVADLATKETDRGQLAELMVGRPLKPPEREALEPGEPVLRLDKLTVSGADGRALLDQVDLIVRAHEIVGVAGVSGNGQSALADLLSGLAKGEGGSFELFGSPVTEGGPRDMVDLGVGRIPEDRLSSGVVGDLSLWENAIVERYRSAAFSRLGVLRLGEAARYAKRIIERFDVRCPSHQVETRLLSGGNIQKLILGRVLSESPKLILANQPTRGLDVGAVAYVQGELLAARREGAGILLISEDLDELLDLSDHIVVIYRGHLSPPFPRDRVSQRILGLMMAGQDPQLAGYAA